MPEEYAPQGATNEIPMRIRDLEEKQRLLKERVVLIGENLVSNRDQSFEDVQMMKKVLLELKEEQIKMKEFLQRLAQQTSELARREELMIVQRQLDMLKPAMEH